VQPRNDAGVNKFSTVPQPGSIGCWVLAIRPRTLAVGLVPVVLGTALAAMENAVHMVAALAACGGALAIQIGSNLVNDYADAKKGADGQDRLGPIRVTSAGLLPASAVWRAALFAFGFAALLGLYLIFRGGWPIFWIGVFSIFFGIIYTAGPAPLAYLGLGDFAAFFFFGPVATAGTFYVQTLVFSPQVVLLGFAPGLFSVALLAINNLRDRATDERAGKKTLAVRFGERFARMEVVACLLLAPMVPLMVLGRISQDWSLRTGLLAIGGVLLALPVILPVLQGATGRPLNLLLGRTARAALGFCLLFVFLLLWLP